MNTQVGCQGGHLASEPAKPKRMAWMAVSRELFKQVCGEGIASLLELKELALGFNVGSYPFLHRLAEQVYEKVHRDLMLPDNAKVVWVGYHLFLIDRPEVALHIECPDFRTVLEGCTMPQVDAMYYCTEDLLGRTVTHFDGWCNDAAVVGDYQKLGRVPTDRCSEEWGHFAYPSTSLCYCGQVGKVRNRETGEELWIRIPSSYTFGAIWEPGEAEVNQEVLDKAVQEGEQKKSSNRGYEFL